LEKNRFHTLLANYTSLTNEEALELISLEKEFPYSQVIHSLTARATQDNEMIEKEYHLHLGAIYTTDRIVFKSIMTAPPQKRKPVVYNTPEVETADIFKNPEAADYILESTEILTATGSPVSSGTSIPDQTDSIPHFTETDFDESIYSELQHDLQKLKELRHEFEETVKQFENETMGSHSLSDEIQKTKTKKTDSTDELLTEIKSLKKQIKPEGPRQKEQIEIIDQFIKTQPSIKGKGSEEMAVPKDDLSEKSLIYNENIISETLVQILIKQGKNEKAIEVLKKLIWKFPQKKAYFAAQIEDLKQ